MIDFLKKFIGDDSGASAAEYALILVIIGVGLVIGALALAGAIEDAMSSGASCAETQAEGAC